MMILFLVLSTLIRFQNPNRIMGVFPSLIGSIVNRIEYIIEKEYIQKLSTFASCHMAVETKTLALGPTKLL